MNPEEFKTFLQDVLNNPEKMGNIDEVLAKSLNMYKELVGSIKEATPEERKKIQESLLEINQFFSQQFDAVSSKMGMSKEELLTQMKNPNNYSQEVWGSIKKFESEVDKEKRSLIRTVHSAGTNKIPKKASKKKTSIKTQRVSV